MKQDMFTSNTNDAVWKATQKCKSDSHRMYWMWLSFSLEFAHKQVPRVLAFRADSQSAYEAARILVMEWWTVRAFLKKLGLSTSNFDTTLKDLKAFRDALAHSDERSDGLIKVSGVKGLVSTQNAMSSVAGGLLSTTNGVDWNLSGATSITGLHMSQGLHCIFGMVDDWIITNTDQGAVQIHLSQKLFDDVDRMVEAEANRY